MTFLPFFALAIQVHGTNLSDVAHRRYRKRYKNDVCFDVFLQIEINLKRARKNDTMGNLKQQTTQLCWKVFPITFGDLKI